MVLTESPYLSESSCTLRTSNLSSNAYILSIASLPGHYAASTSAPSNVIEIFDKTTLRRIQTLLGHEPATTSLRTVNNIAGISKKSLISSGKDGSVKVWDERSNSHCIKMTNLGKPHALLCCDVSSDGFTVAAGTDLQGDDALILYWDPRQPATPLRTHGSTHSDDITTLSFNETGTLLLSASTDGLVSTSNPSEDDEDEAVLGVGKWGCSVSQAGWINGSASGGAAIWAASDMETFSTWSDELDQLMSVDIREPSVHTQQRTWVTDYLLTCDARRGVLNVFTGSNEGDVALLTNANPSVDDAAWSLHSLWTAGHVGVVRSLLYDEEQNVLVTGGEDGRLNVWPWPIVNASANDGRDSEMDVDIPAPSPLPTFSPPRKRRDRDMSPPNGRSGRRDPEDHSNGEEAVKRARR